MPAFKAFLGGPLGNGSQPFSWLHMRDLIEATIFLINREDLEGTFNLTAPNPVSNRELAKTLGEVLRRPAFLPAQREFVLGQGAGLIGTEHIDTGQFFNAG